MPGFASSARAMLFMHPRDIGLFLRSARTDAAIADTRGRLGPRAAFDAVYAAGDPWASGDPRYLYQRRKYEVLMGLLPEGRRFARALDIGCGTGILSRLLARRAEHVLGVDISGQAVAQAIVASADMPALSFAQGDVLDLAETLDGGFDLVVIADTLYYLPPPLDDAMLGGLALRVARLLRPGGVCMIANHFFSGLDADSRVSRRIHAAFAASPALRVLSEHRRPFYLVSVLEGAAAPV
jgi:2-polyprenyl-3-methyl-5-hydroxy-6-metoxy-1,4-benzoquinol methylase